MSTILFGNSAAHEVLTEVDSDGVTVMGDDGKPVEVKRPIPGNQITTVMMPDNYTESEKFLTVTHDNGLWGRHSADKPVWVESDDAELAQALGYFYGCPVGRPDGWEVTVND